MMVAEVQVAQALPSAAVGLASHGGHLNAVAGNLRTASRSTWRARPVPNANPRIVNGGIPVRRPNGVHSRFGRRDYAAPARERFMRMFAILLAAPGIFALLCLAGAPSVLAQQKPAEQPAAQQPSPAPAGKAPIDKFSVVSQS